MKCRLDSEPSNGRQICLICVSRLLQMEQKFQGFIHFTTDFFAIFIYVLYISNEIHKNGSDYFWK